MRRDRRRPTRRTSRTPASSRRSRRSTPHRRVPAVLPGRRLPAEGRVQRVRHRRLRLPRRPRGRTSRSSTSPNGTGPYMLKEWSKGNRMVLEANPNYWGTKALTPNVEFRWSDEAAQRLAGAPVGQRRRHRQPRHRRHPDHQGRLERSRSTRARASTPSTSASMTRSSRGTTRRSARRSPWASTASGSSTTSTPRAPRSPTHFTPVRDPVRLRRRRHLGLQPRPGEARSSPRACRKRASTKINTKLQFRAAVRGYLPDPPQIATEIAGQLKDNLGINATLDLQESGTFLDDERGRHPRRDLPARLGCRLPRRRPTSSTTTSARARARSSATPFADIVGGPDQGRASRADDADRAGRLHRGQQPHQAARARRSSSPTAAPARRSRPTSTAPTPRRSATRCSRS